MKPLQLVAAIVYAVTFLAALGPIIGGGEARMWALGAVLATPAAWAMGTQQEDETWRSITIGTGLIVGAFLALNALSA